MEIAQNQTAVYWAPAAAGFDEFGAPLSAATGVEVACRWSERFREDVAPDGTTFRQSAVVHPASLVQRGGFMVEGTLATVVDADDPAASGAQEIIAVKVTPGFSDELDNIRAVVGQWQ